MQLDPRKLSPIQNRAGHDKRTSDRSRSDTFKMDVPYSGLRWYGIVRGHHSMLRIKKPSPSIELRNTEYLMQPCWLFVCLPGCCFLLPGKRPFVFYRELQARQIILTACLFLRARGGGRKRLKFNHYFLSKLSPTQQHNLSGTWG